MGLYPGIDLHASNNMLGVIDGGGKRIAKRKLSNDPGFILGVLRGHTGVR